MRTLNIIEARTSIPILTQSRSVLNPRVLQQEFAARQVTDQPLDWMRLSLAQSQIEACFRLVTQKQTEVAELLQSLVQQVPVADVEVGGGYVEGMAVVLLQEGVEHVGHFVLLVVDDEGDGGHWSVRLFSLRVSLIISYGGKLV